MLFNASAVQSKFKVASSRSAFLAIFQFLAPKKFFEGLAPIRVQRWKLHFSPYRLVKVSWKSVQPFPRTVVSYFLTDREKTKNRKNICKTYTHLHHLVVRMRKIWQKSCMNLIAGIGSASSCRICSHNCSWAFGTTVHTASTSRALRIVSALQMMSKAQGKKTSLPKQRYISDKTVVRAKAARNVQWITNY